MDLDARVDNDVKITNDSYGSPGSLHLYPKWALVLTSLLLSVGISITVAWPITVPYYTMSPGPVYDTSDFVEVAEGTVSREGELFFLTVALNEANVFEYAAGMIDERVTIQKRDVIRPPGVTQEDLRRESLDAMGQSKQDATYVALTRLGYEATFIGTGALVIETIPDTGADGVLMPDDIIIEMDGKTIAFRSDIVDQLGLLKIGDDVTFLVERPTDDSLDVYENESLKLELGPHSDDQSRPMIGVLIGNNEPVVEFPVEVVIDSQNIGGPSAGMMFTLQIIDQLTEDELTNGYRIAGTGTIRRDGTVGPIGGIRQKVYGAIDAGAYAVLVPEANFDEAQGAAGDEIVLVSIATIDDALDYLGSL